MKIYYVIDCGNPFDGALYKTDSIFDAMEFVKLYKEETGSNSNFVIKDENR